MSVLDFAIWDDLAVIFSVHKAARRPAKKIAKIKAFSSDRTTQWAVRSDRPDPVPGSFWQVRTHAMMWNRDHLGVHHVLVWALIKQQRSI